MLSVEDLIDRLSCNGKYLFDSPIIRYSVDQSIIDSFSEQISKGLGLTQKQRNHSLNIIRRYYKLLGKELNVNIDSIINPPNFSSPLRIVNNQKTIEIDRVHYDTPKIILSFPYHQVLVDRVRDYKRKQPRFEALMIEWNSTMRGWIFNLNEQNVIFLSELLSEGFTADEDFLNVLSEIRKIEENFSEYIPHLTYSNNTFKLQNTHSSIPAINCKNLIDALVASRRYGINTWDDTVDLMIKSTEVSSPVRDFFKGKFANNSIATIPNAVLEDFSEVLKYNKKTLFVIPGGNELHHLKFIRNLLKQNGYTDSDLSVLFRLEQKTGKDFNEYVKLSNLNNPIDDNIRAFFISKKIPNPLAEKNYHFDLIVYFGITAAHYTLKFYLRDNFNSIKLNLVTDSGNIFNA